MAESPVIWPVPGQPGRGGYRPQPPPYPDHRQPPIVIQHPRNRWLPWAVFGFLGLIAVVAIVVVVLVLTLRGHDSTTPASDGFKLGQALAPKLAPALAVGFRAHRKALQDGKSFKEADEILKDTFHVERAKAFAVTAGAAFNAVAPEGKEPTNPAVREAMEKLDGEFADGLDGGQTP